MASGLRRVELVEAGDTEPVAHADHVVGVDESGNTRRGPFVVTAVQCPRRVSERLAEALISLGLNPWVNKSSARPPGMSGDELSARVRRLIAQLEELPVTWTAVAGWASYTTSQWARTACVAVTKAMTRGGPPTYDGPAVMIHDGAASLFGRRGISLRRAADVQFEGFDNRVTPVYLSCLRNADLTYPEVMVADYVSGYLKSRIESVGLDGTSTPVERIDPSWCAPADRRPTTLFDIRQRTRRRGKRKKDRTASWIEGRRPSDGDAWGGQSMDSLVQRSESERLSEYLLTEL